MTIQKKSEIDSNPALHNSLSTLDILKKSGLIGCVSAEPDFSIHSKSVLQEELDAKYNNC